MKKLNVIGAGRLGRVVAHLFCQTKNVELGSVVNRTLDSAKAAVEFIGQGKAADQLVNLPECDITLIACPDDDIASVAASLADSDVIKPGSVVFHCSGMLSSKALASLKLKGVKVASVHPLQTFVGEKISLADFNGTYCVVEGEEDALENLKPLLQHLGANIVSVAQDRKCLYHAASVMGCNYLVALLDMSLQMMEASGIARGTALDMLQPLLNQTLQNIYSRDTVQALTGPIARGDVQTVNTHLKDIEQLLPELSDAYRLLGNRATQLSAEQGNASEDNLKLIAEQLSKEN